MTDYTHCPGGPVMREAMQRYIENHIPPGSFLTAVLSNDLKEACQKADLQNQRLIFEYVKWLWNNAPCSCWGSPEAVANWLETRHAF